ncbi:MAG: AAA family ATPase, partial [Desulfohalobiaceae bacterium]|nr:AAA family ATPase [Desulfohalobiaceae bacterium]
MNNTVSLELTRALAEKEAAAAGFSEMEPEHLILGVLKFAELPDSLLRMLAPGLDETARFQEEQKQIQEYLGRNRQDSKTLRRRLRKALGRPRAPRRDDRLRPSAAAFELLQQCHREAQARGKQRPGALDLLLTTWSDPPTPLLREHLATGQPLPRDPRQTGKAASGKGPVSSPDPLDLAEFTTRLKELRNRLLNTILGQNHAIHAFVDGLFNAEALAGADPNRKRPKGLFVFAGPPGVGKTFLAETGADILGKPFLRLDMSGYGDEMGVKQLVGAQRSYQAAKPGKLTAFVRDNPGSILLFDEIEKAGLDVIHLFLQLLDNGSLEDKFSEENVIFRDTIVIFTTNAGKSLYEDKPAAGAVLHRRTILSALEQEVDPRTRKPFFPQAICSRMATGYPVMFNHLGVSELVAIAAQEMEHVGGLFEQAHGKSFAVDPAVPLCLVLREGAGSDARTVRSQAEIFCKSEFFNLLRHMSAESLQEHLKTAGRVSFSLGLEEQTSLEPAIEQLLCPEGTPRVLLAGRSGLADGLTGLETVQTVPVTDPDTVKTVLATGNFDLVLIDPWLDAAGSGDGSRDPGATVACFEKAPIGASSLERGMSLLRGVRESPDAPEIWLLNLLVPGSRQGSIDDELMISAARYGARGRLDLRLEAAGPDTGDDPQVVDPEALRDFEGRLLETVQRVRREQAVAELGGQGKVLTFDTSPAVHEQGMELAIRLRGLRLVEAPAADDAAGLLSEAERPSTGFDDVFGADQAKAELGHIADWLQEPRKFAGLGLKPPKGVLLHGPPGTGKTMLARALAGESKVAFLVESATSFVTKYVGSGPENVRNLFARGRRYAPSIIFIDEIDAVGKKREGTQFNRHQEETLNSILTEMDGFSSPAARPVIVIAATNLVDKLDPALVRRFDREVEVDKPDRAGREAFLHKRLAPGTHCRVSEPVIGRIAGQSTGQTIADLERMIRLAGRRAAQKEGIISDDVLEDAFESARMG